MRKDSDRWADRVWLDDRGCYTTWLSPVYNVVDNLVRPLYWLSNIPSRVQEWGQVSGTSALILRKKIFV